MFPYCRASYRYNVLHMPDSITIVPRAKLSSDHFITTWVAAEWNVHRTWITMENHFLKWAGTQESVICDICMTLMTFGDVIRSHVKCTSIWTAISKWKSESTSSVVICVHLCPSTDPFRTFTDVAVPSSTTEVVLHSADSRFAPSQWCKPRISPEHISHSGCLASTWKIVQGAMH